MGFFWIVAGVTRLELATSGVTGQQESQKTRGLATDKCTAGQPRSTGLHLKTFKVFGLLRRFPLQSRANPTGPENPLMHLTQGALNILIYGQAKADLLAILSSFGINASGLKLT